MMFLRKAIRTIFLVVIVFSASHAVHGEDKPLSMRDIARMKYERMSLDKIVKRASERGVSFSVSPAVEKQLSRLGFSPQQISAIQEASAPRGKAGDAAGKDGDDAGKDAAIAAGKELGSSDQQRDFILEQVTKITKLSGVDVQPVASRHITVWAGKEEQAAFMPDIKKIEKFLEGKCQEPLRSGLDKRSAHLLLMKTRYDYEKWLKAMFEVIPESTKLPDAPGGDIDLKPSILKSSGYYTHNFAVICLQGQDALWSHRTAAADVGFMNFVQQIDPQRHDPLATGFANGVESLVAGTPQVMLFSNSYQNFDRDLGKDPRAWLHLVQDRMRTRKESSLRGLLNMDTTNMRLPQYAEAWTLAGVLAKQPEKFGKLLFALREEKDTLKAIEQVYGWDEKKLEGQWHKEVLGQR